MEGAWKKHEHVLFLSDDNDGYTWLMTLFIKQNDDIAGDQYLDNEHWCWIDGPQSSMCIPASGLETMNKPWLTGGYSSYGFVWNRVYSQL